MPHMNDPFFSKSVVLICDHNSHGSMGIILNKKLDQEKSNPRYGVENLSNERLIFFGGPVMVNFTLLLQWLRAFFIKKKNFLYPLSKK